MRALARRALLPVLLLAVGLPGSAASFPPQLPFRSLRGERLTLHYQQGLEPIARRALPLAEQILARHELRYGVRPKRVQIVLSDEDDSPNGLASPWPYPFVRVRAAAPAGDEDFGNLESWLRLVLTHELAHVVHLDQGHGLVRVGRKLFGRAPFLFPNTLTPTWMIEGLATYEETRGSAFGRGRHSDARMLRRMAALEGRFPGEDRPVLGLDDWPSGQAPYVFGEAFLRDLDERLGARVLPELARVNASHALPFLDDWSARRVTGGSFHALWRAWREREQQGFVAEAEHLEQRGLTSSQALTTRGFEQRRPRFSPDGRWIAYDSSSRLRQRELRLMRSDGSGDRALVDRYGGRGLSFTPDGRTLVYDELEFEHTFELRGGLRALDLESGQARWIARGLRASDPDVAPDGLRLVYVERQGDRSELCTLGLDGRERQELTHSAPETQWSRPRFSPDGQSVVAARWQPGGLLDLVLVDLQTGALRELTHDRARDVEPSFTPDGARVVFRSDRDGVSNLYALELASGSLERLTRVLGGAFDPAVAPDGRRVAFASYSARGYDVHVSELALGQAGAAEPFEDPYPPAQPELPASDASSSSYQPLGLLWPRFYVPYAAEVSGQWRVGVASAGFDVLARHLWGLELHRGLETERLGARGFYQYDRFRPTFLLTLEDVSDPDPRSSRLRTQNATLRASLPLVRRLRHSSSLSLAWRFERQTELDLPGARPFDLGGLELALAFSSARRQPYSISPSGGWRARLAYLREAPALGSDIALGELYGETRAYLPVGGRGDVLAVRGGAGTTLGRPAFRSAFRVGGFPAGDLFDVVGTNAAVLRGYPDDFESGRHFAHLSLEYRRPLLHPQRGWRTLPVFLRHVHAAAFVDGARAWSDDFAWRDVKLGLGVALGSDLNLGHGLPFTFTLGLAHGLNAGGDTRGYLRVGLSF